MKILVIGGAGYIGTSLCNYLALQKKLQVTCLDTFWFGNFLNKKIKTIKADIRTYNFNKLNRFDVVIDLAYLSNDPLCDVDARHTWESGPLSVYKILEYCNKKNVNKFIFASSGSIYGLKKERNVTENLGLDPLTDYNKSKMICEKVVESYSKKINTAIIRPATVCGYSPRLRLDVVLNMFCYQAYFKKKILVLGGDQTRPLVNIIDMIRCYDFVIKNNVTGCYNLGFENKSVKQIASDVKKIIPCDITFKKSIDKRSYRINSDKILKIGFKPMHTSVDAIWQLKNAFEKNFLPSKINWNLEWLAKKKFLVS
jgi:nucleoside-diphosphate-sugar epimerase